MRRKPLAHAKFACDPWLLHMCLTVGKGSHKWLLRAHKVNVSQVNVANCTTGKSCWVSQVNVSQVNVSQVNVSQVNVSQVNVSQVNPPAPMNHVKIFKGWPPRDAPSKLVQLWYKSFPTDFPPDQRGQVEMKKPTRLSNKTSTAWSCAEDQILENRNRILNICTERWVKYFLKSI